MTQSQRKFAAGAILAVCLLLAAAGGVLAAPADAGQETAQSEQKQHAESTASSEESHAPDAEEHDRTARITGNLQNVAGILAERLNVSVDELVWAAMQGPEALRELGINPRALSRVLMVAEARAMPAGQGPAAVHIRPAEMRERMVQTEERMAARGRITRNSYVRGNREPDADRRLDHYHRDYAAGPQPFLDSGDVLALTAHKLGLHPAKLKAAFQESAMALALESIGMKSRFGAYTAQGVPGHKLARETEEGKSHGYGWPGQGAGKGWNHEPDQPGEDKDALSPAHSDHDGGQKGEEENDQDEAQGLPIHNGLLAF